MVVETVVVVVDQNDCEAPSGQRHAKLAGPLRQCLPGAVVKRNAMLLCRCNAPRGLVTRHAHGLGGINGPVAAAAL
jgi:hypothetical protein